MSQSILESAIEYALESGNNAYIFHVNGVEAFTHSKELAESMDTENNVFIVDPVEVLAEREYNKALDEARNDMEAGEDERWCFRCDSVQHECFCDDPIYWGSSNPDHIKFLEESYPDFFQNVREGGLIPDDMDFDGVLNFDDGEVQFI